MPTYGSERAVILPQLQNASEPGWRAIDNIQQNQRVAEEKRRYEQQRQDQMLQNALEKLDYSKFATATIYDPIINQNVNDRIKSVAEKITNGGYASNADMYMDVMTGAADIASFSNAIKLQRANIDKELEQYEKDSSIDINKLKQTAYNRAFWTYDKNGNQVSIRKPNEFENKSYVDEVLNDSPELVIKGTQPLYESLSKLNSEDVGMVYKRRDKSGKLTDSEYSGKLYEHQEIYEDKETGEMKSRVKRKEITLPDGTKSYGMEDNSFKRIFGSEVPTRILNSEFNKLYKKDILEGRIKEDDIPALKSQLALQLVESSRVGGIKNKDIIQERMPSTRVYNNISTGTTTPVRDIYGIINNMASEREGRHLQINLLAPDIQQKIVGIANDVGFKRYVLDDKGKPTDKIIPYTNASIYIKKEPNGLVLRDATQNKLIAVLDEASLNVGMQPTAKGKNAVIGDTNQDNSGGYREVRYDEAVVDKAFKKHGYIKEATAELEKLGYSAMQIKQATKRMVQLKAGKSNTTNNNSGSWKDRAKKVN